MFIFIVSIKCSKKFIYGRNFEKGYYIVLKFLQHISARTLHFLAEFNEDIFILYWIMNFITTYSIQTDRQQPKLNRPMVVRCFTYILTQPISWSLFTEIGNTLYTKQDISLKKLINSCNSTSTQIKSQQCSDIF